MTKRLIIAQVLYLISVIIVSLLFEAEQTKAVLAGLVLSTLFVNSNVLLIKMFWKHNQKLFMRVFFISLPLRFVLLLGAFGLILGLTKIPEIYFTVSLIISYLFQSVTEMIFIHKILQKSSTQS